MTDKRESINESKPPMPIAQSVNKGLSIKFDASEAITGLKAIQREAKEAVRALREVEELTNRRTQEEKIVPHALYECLVCEHKEQVRGRKEDYLEIRICPKCKGAFVDVWKIVKYR